jgi:hypothetical protein
LRKYFIVLTMFVLFLGCGRVGDGSEVGNIRTFSDKSGVRSDFDIIRKSQFIQNSNTYVKQGHYSLLFKYSGDNKNLHAKLYENGSKYSSSASGEAKVDIDPNNNSITNNILLLLDFSGSIIKDYSFQLRESVKSFINGVQNDKTKIAIYYFNSKKMLTPIIADPMNDSARLIEEVNRLDDSYFKKIKEENLISTNLHGAVIEASGIACKWVGNCSSDIFDAKPTLKQDNFEFASVVVFTDGIDQAGWASKSEMFDTINSNEALFYQGVGVGDADKNFINKISTDAGIYESKLNVDSIKSVFDKLTVWANSFYEARYCPADQAGSVDIEIKLENSKSYIGSIKENDVKLQGSDFRCDIN